MEIKTRKQVLRENKELKSRFAPGDTVYKYWSTETFKIVSIPCEPDNTMALIKDYKGTITSYDLSGLSKQPNTHVIATYLHNREKFAPARGLINILYPILVSYLTVRLMTK